MRQARHQVFQSISKRVDLQNWKSSARDDSQLVNFNTLIVPNKQKLLCYYGIFIITLGNTLCSTKQKKKQAATMAVVYLHRIVLAYIVAK